MKHNVFAKIWAFLLAIFIISSCSNENEIAPVALGTYQRIVIIGSDGGENMEEVPQTKALDESGAFTADYDADYVYIHSYNEGEGEDDKWVRVPVRRNLESCGSDCQGFQLEITVTEDGYKINNGTDDSGFPKVVIFSKDEKVYLSSIPTEEWKGKTSTSSPLTGQTVLVRDDDNGVTGSGGTHGELYRSEYEYSMEDLVNGSHGVSNKIIMKRKSSAFLVYFLFTDFDNSHTEGWGKDQRIVYQPTDEHTLTLDEWTGKIYLGPCFCDEYNVESGTPTYSEGASGYYASYDQKYVNFESLTYQGGAGVGGIAYEYRGYGVRTIDTYLITPYDSENEGEMKFYAFVKRNNDDEEADNESKYLSYTFTGLTAPDYNTTHIYVVMYDIDHLLAAFPNEANVFSRSIAGPQKIELQPIEVIHIQE